MFTKFTKGSRLSPQFPMPGGSIGPSIPAGSLVSRPSPADKNYASRVLSVSCSAAAIGPVFKVQIGFMWPTDALTGKPHLRGPSSRLSPEHAPFWAKFAGQSNVPITSSLPTIGFLIAQNKGYD